MNSAKTVRTNALAGLALILFMKQQSASWKGASALLGAFLLKG
jgi:hypothetical protein